MTCWKIWKKVSANLTADLNFRLQTIFPNHIQKTASQKNGCQRKADDQPKPHAGCTHMIMKSKQPSERKPDYPIGKRYQYGGNFDIFDTAQEPGTDSLCRIRNLKHGSK